MAPKNKTTAGWITLVLLSVALFSYVFNTTTRIQWDVVALIATFFALVLLILKFDPAGKSIPIAGYKFKPELAVDLLLAMLYSLFIFKIKIHTFFDDAGFLLRYLDHFSEGYFFTFNTSEGPVLGISSFLYGLLCGGIATTHLLDNRSEEHTSELQSH